MVRYVHLPGSAVDTALLEDATRRGQLLSARNPSNCCSYVNILVLQKQHNRHRRRNESSACEEVDFKLRIVCSGVEESHRSRMAVVAYGQATSSTK